VSMKCSAKAAAMGGLVGILFMFGIWLSGTPRFWLLFLWPSRLVGVGLDKIFWPAEIAIQFSIYAMVAFTMNIVWRISRGNA
jgi:hypothetical protein